MPPDSPPPTAPDLTKVPTAELEREIALLQQIQKINSPRTDVWKRASEQLAPLFAEMKRRQR